MLLSSAQKLVVKAYLDANAAGFTEVAAANLLNTLASPTYLVWKSRVTLPEVQASASFDWTRVDNLSVGKARIWDGMFNATDSMEPWRGNYRTGIVTVWVGTQADLAVQASVLASCQRPVTNLEKLFVVQTTDGPAQTGNRGASTNADKLGLNPQGGFVEGSVNDQFVADIIAGL
jgi:hypothetical protein